jgi:hypothetical protein
VAEDGIAAAGAVAASVRGRRAESLSAVLLTFDGHGYQLRAGEVSLELARLGDPAIVRVRLCGAARSVARMRRALFMAGMPLQSIQTDEFVPAVISG